MRIVFWCFILALERTEGFSTVVPARRRFVMTATPEEPKIKAATVGAWKRVKSRPWVLVGLTAATRRPLTALVATVVWQATLGDPSSRRRMRIAAKRSPFKLFVSTPLTAAFVGWLTNWVGVKMLFYPIRWRGLKLAERQPISAVGDLPAFGLFGWQGIVAAKAPRMARDLVDVVTKRLVSPDAALRRLSATKIADFVDVPKAIARAAGFAPTARPWELVASNDETVQALKAECRHLALGVAKDVRLHGAKCLNLQALCVRELSGPNVKALIDLFQQVGKVELRFLINSGIVVGFFLGLIQSLIAASLAPKYFKSDKSKDTVELVGAGIVGAVTNWVALLWIFSPIEPVRLFGGLVTLQGKFLQRQAAVSRDFAAFFAHRILTARNLLPDILQSANFRPLLRRRIAAFADAVARETSAGPLLRAVSSHNADALDFFTDRVATTLPDVLPDALFDYTDSSLDLGTTIGSRLAKLPPRDFERLLHPIFEEDEATLIAVGGVLGVFASWVQLRLLNWWHHRRRRSSEELVPSVLEDETLVPPPPPHGDDHREAALVTD